MTKTNEVVIMSPLLVRMLGTWSGKMAVTAAIVGKIAVQHITRGLGKSDTLVLNRLYNSLAPKIDESMSKT